MRISAGGVTCVATLAHTATATAIWNALPIQGRANRWGDELYFDVPIELEEEEDDARDAVDIGAVAYWPPGNAVCIFWGPTPASHDQEPRAASRVNVFGQIADGAADFRSVHSGVTVRLERS